MPTEQELEQMARDWLVYTGWIEEVQPETKSEREWEERVIADLTGVLRSVQYKRDEEWKRKARQYLHVSVNPIRALLEDMRG